MLSRKQSSQLRKLALIGGVLLALYSFILLPDGLSASYNATSPFGLFANSKETQHPEELLNNRFLTRDKCEAAFPGLFKEVDDAVAKGPFNLKMRESDSSLFARIKNGKVYSSSSIHVYSPCES